MALNTIASAATITVTAPIHGVSGTAAISTINGILDGQGVVLIPSGIFTLATGGNIAAARTAAVGKAIDLRMANGLLYEPGA